jgi:hypothetical protein
MSAIVLYQAGRLVEMHEMNDSGSGPARTEVTVATSLATWA